MPIDSASSADSAPGRAPSESGVGPRVGGDVIPEAGLLRSSIYCPFEVEWVPVAPEVADGAEQWRLDRLADLGGTVSVARTAQLASELCPLAGPAQLALAIDFLQWGFALERCVEEHQEIQEPTGLAQLLRRLEGILRGSPPQRDAERIELALHDVLKRFARFASREEMQAFAVGNRRRFDALLWEGANRSLGWLPDELTYVNLAPNRSPAAALSYALAPLNQIRSSTGGMADSHVRNCRWLARRVCCWISDLLSLDDARTRRGGHNLVWIRASRRGAGLAEVVPSSLDFCNREIEEFAARTAQLQEVHAHQREVVAYGRRLGGWVAATLRFAGAAEAPPCDDLVR